jgi:hypothetical protein
MPRGSPTPRVRSVKPSVGMTPTDSTLAAISTETMLTDRETNLSASADPIEQDRQIAECLKIQFIGK